MNAVLGDVLECARCPVYSMWCSPACCVVEVGSASPGWGHAQRFLNTHSHKLPPSHKLPHTVTQAATKLSRTCLTACRRAVAAACPSGWLRAGCRMCSRRRRKRLRAARWRGSRAVWAPHLTARHKRSRSPAGHSGYARCGRLAHCMLASAARCLAVCYLHFARRYCFACTAEPGHAA